MPTEPVLVFVVEDNADIRQSLTEILEEEGFRVEAAADGTSALERLHAAGPLPSVVLSDVMMPNLSGYELLAVMRRTEPLARIPVVLMTAFNLSAPPGVYCLRKPIDVDELLVVISRAMEAAKADR